MTTPPPHYRVILINPRTGRRKPLRTVHSNFYRAADMCKFYEGRGQRSGRPVLCEIVTVMR